MLEGHVNQSLEVFTSIAMGEARLRAGRSRITGAVSNGLLCSRTLMFFLSHQIEEWIPAPNWCR